MTARDPDGAESAGAGPRRPCVPLGRWLGIGALAVGVVWLLSLAAPESARAIDPNPLHALGDVLDAGADAVTGGVGKLAVDGFGGIIKTLFAWPAKMINRELLAWLVAVPDYAIHPDLGRGGRDGSNLAAARRDDLGDGVRGARRGRDGVGDPLLGRRADRLGRRRGARGAGANGRGGAADRAVAVAVPPRGRSGQRGRARAAGQRAACSTTPRGCSPSRSRRASRSTSSRSSIAIAAALLFLALLVSKIAVSAGTALVFVGMPLALMLWPIPELAWIARAAMRVFATVLAIPLAWAVCFATFAAVGVDALALKGAGKAVDALIMPLVAVALLWMVVALPKTLARMAMSGAAVGGGFVGRTASRVAARRVDAAVTQGVSTVSGRRGAVPQAGGHDSSRERRRQDGTPAARAR